MIAPGTPDAPFQIIDARALVAFCLDALEDRTVGIFNVTSPSDHRPDQAGGLVRIDSEGPNT